jgi:hypothetical protein
MGIGAIATGDVALALTLPCDEVEFRDLASLGGESDFYSRLAEGNGGTNIGAAWSYYEKAFGAFARDTVAYLRELRVTVVTRANAETISEVLRRFKVVGLMAHHPSKRFEVEDFLDLRSLADAIDGRNDSGTRVLREIMGHRYAARDFARECNRLLEESATAYDALAENRRVATESSPFAFSRLWFEEQFPGLVRQSPCIELWKEELTIDGFLALFPESYAGALDLMVCNSILHTEALKKRHPRALIAANAAQARAAARLARFASMMAVLSRYGRLDVKDLLQAAIVAGHAS